MTNKGDNIFRDCSTHEAIRQGTANSGEQLEYVSTQVNNLVTFVRSHHNGIPSLLLLETCSKDI